MPMQLDEQTKEEINSKLQTDIDETKIYYEDNIEKKVINRYDMFWAEPEYYKKKFKNLSRNSSLTSCDIQNTIECLMPTIMKTFFGTENVINIQPVGDEDEEKAKTLELLLKYQLERKNKAFVIFYNWFKDSLITGAGVIKCYWDRQEDHKEDTQVMSTDAISQLRQSGVEIGDMKQLSADMWQVSYTIKNILVNQPKIENILLSELLYSPRARTLEEAPFVAHRKKVTIDYLRRKEIEGMYEKGTVDKVVAEMQDPQDTQLEILLMNAGNSTTPPNYNKVDDARKEVELFECYTKLDVNHDGLLENLIITKVGNVILRVEENIYGRHPFFILSPYKDPHTIMPRKSYTETIGQLQDLKTALTKMIMTNTAMTNDPRIVMSEEAINIEDYTSGRSVIRKKAGFSMADACQLMPTTPIAPWTFQYLQYIDDQQADRTGVTKYTQGSDSSSLNKTASGISAIMQAGNARIDMICRMFTETAVQDLYRFLIELNQKFLDQNTVIRLAGKPLTITPEDLEGEFDVIVSTGLAMGTKEMTLMNIQTIITTAMQISSTPVGQSVISPKNIYNLLKKYLEELGIKNAQEFLSDPDVVQQQQEMMQTQALQQLQQLFNQMPPEIQQAIIANGGNVPMEMVVKLPLQIQNLLKITGGNILGHGNTDPNGDPAGQQSTGGKGISSPMAGGVQGVGNSPTSPVQNGGYNPVQNYAPRS